MIKCIIRIDLLQPNSINRKLRVKSQCRRIKEMEKHL